jgi:hypothetical protein
VQVTSYGVELLPIIGYVGWLASAIVPMVVAARAGTFFLADLLLLVAPAVAFLVGLALFNESALTGWAFIVYPIGIVALSIALLHARVFVLPWFGVAPQNAARITSTGALIASVVLGACVPPLYE